MEFMINIKIIIKNGQLRKIRHQALIVGVLIEMGIFTLEKRKILEYIQIGKEPNKAEP